MTAEEFAKPLQIGDETFVPGDRRTIQLPIGHLVTHEIVHLTVHVRRGTKPGPRLLVTGAVHGDEINGVEIVRRLRRRKMRGMAGDLLLIPIVNQPAFVARSRYLPDRRDLNRLFPGSANGSFGARLARVLTKDIAATCTHGIDLHTGAVNRPNLPQTRFSEDIPGSRELAQAFGAPVMIASSIRPRSFRDVFGREGKPQVLFEGGEAGNLEPASVGLGVEGVLSCMRFLGMLRPLKRKKPPGSSVLCTETYWERAPRGGLFIPSAHLGKVVEVGTVLGEIGDPFGTENTSVLANQKGVIIGRTRSAVVDEGDGIIHIGITKRPGSVTDRIEAAEAELDHSLDHPVFDDAMED